jgi:O-antigen/teichoic acid export membrane protein
LSRTRRAGIAAVFGYLQFGTAVLTGIILLPFILKRVGTAEYGVWLAFGELLAYSAMVDLGVVGVLPWLVAESDGAGDRAGMRSLLAGGLAFATGAGIVFTGIALLLLWLAPNVANVTAAQRAAVEGPLMFLLVAMAAAFPVRVFYAVLIGLQDVKFTGAMSVAQVALNPLLIVSLLLAGEGLYALAAGAAMPGLFVGIISLFRLRKVAPDLLHGWRLPPGPVMRRMTAQGLGNWTAGFGWRMVAASNSIVLLSVAGPEAAVVYAVTAKLGDVLMQMSWQLPDAGLVGLAQLKGEGRPRRVAEVTVSILRLVLLGAGAVACGVLAFNPSFVTLWMGAPRFGGLALNAALAALVLAHSLGHGLFSTSATLGTRVAAGWAALAQGAVHLGAAVLLGHWLGMPGVALAAVASTAAVAYPSGVWMVRKTTGMTQRDLWRTVLGPWTARAAVLLLLGAAVGSFAFRAAVWLPLVLAPPLGVLYLWMMRPLYEGIPLPARVRPWLARLRLIAE